MIDYEKLKIAHELAEKLSINNGVQVELSFFDNKLWKYFLKLNSKKYIFEFRDIDALIAKLTELTEPQVKYEDGSTVFWVFDNIIYSGKTDSLIRWGEKFRYLIQMEHRSIDLDEEQLYPTREALIKSQLEYWSKLAYEERGKPIDEYQPPFEGEVKGFPCEHEPEPKINYSNELNNICIKCGEFY